MVITMTVAMVVHHMIKNHRMKVAKNNSELQPDNVQPNNLKSNDLQQNDALMETNKLMHAPAVNIENLFVSYDKRYAIKNASLTANPNEILALVGPSGCGKTSLLCSINRMTESLKNCQLSGIIKLDDDNVLSADYPVALLRKNVGMVFQQPNPFPLSIRDNICFPIKDHGMTSAKQREEKMREVLKKTGLWDELKDRLDQSALRLSGGQQQRLCIARALALEPKVLLLDEPCSALDPISTERIESLLLELKKSMTLIMVTHNLAQAKRIADQVAVCWVNEGSGYIVECDRSEKIFEQPQSPITLSYCMGHAG